MAEQRDYTVTNQTDVRDYTTSPPRTFIDVDFAGPNNITGRVRVPENAPPADVDAAIRAKLEQRLQIAQLGGGQ